MKNRRRLFIRVTKINKKLITGDRIANVKVFTTTPLTTSTQCAPEATEFSEITQNKNHYAVQGHSTSPILVPIESSYTIRSDYY